MAILQIYTPLPPHTMEEESLLEGGPRVKFSAGWNGTIDGLLTTDKQLESQFLAAMKSMVDVVRELEQAGVTPVLPDGKVGGNVSSMLKDSQGKEHLLVTKSGKIAGQRLKMEDVAVVRGFDNDNWKAEYYAASADVLPTSDTPMHYAALNAWRMYDWPCRPMAIFHGHAFETEEDAKKLGLPISMEETLFSTPEDTAALMKLFKDFPYPSHKIFIRKGHGFMLLAVDMEDGMRVFREKLHPFLKKDMGK